MSGMNCVAAIDLGRTQCEGPNWSRFSQRRIAGQPLVLRMGRRLSESQWVSNVYAVGCELSTRELTQLHGVVQPISLPDCHLVERLCAVVDRTDADWVVYVPANRPFVDAQLIDGLLARAQQHSQCDYIGYTSSSAGHRRSNALGLAGEVCHADTLRRLRRNVDRLRDWEGSIASELGNAPGAYHLKFVDLPRELDRDDLRFSVEDESDWDELQLICDSVCEDDADWHRVAQLVLGNEDLRLAMASRNHP